LEEQRNPASTTSKRTYIHRENRTPRDPTHQNKGPKRTESSRPSNCRRKLDRGSNYNTYLEKDEEVFKSTEIELESNLDFKLESFTYIIRNFDLEDNKSNCFINSLNSKNNVENSKTEDSYLIAFNQSKKTIETIIE